MSSIKKALSTITLSAALLATQNASAVVIESGELDFSGRTNLDIQFNFLDFNYDAVAGDLSISSSYPGANFTKESGDEVYKSGWEFDLNADYSNGELVNSTLSILNGRGKNVLSGSLDSFSIAGPGVFNFLFDDIKGGRADQFGDYVGVIFSDISLPIDFDFTSSFSSSFMGNANTFKNATSVSEPGTFALSLLGLVGLFAARRKSKAN